MPNITYDAQSLIIDGRRLWLVSGAIHYPRIPRQLWRDRIRAAREAGLNCIETYVFWNVHEPQAEQFRFDGDHDLRHFVELIADEGMWCILRPGPYVCAEWDFGGLPAWLLEHEDLALRQASPAFLQATARYLDAVMRQVRDLQITTDDGGPILMVQNENEWFCRNDEQAEAYLDQITRYLRESGCNVPIINCNNFYQPVANTINCWNGWNQIRRDARQLRVAQPDAPRLITELWTGWFDAWDGPHDPSKTAQDVLRTLAEVSSTGAQFNLYMFHGGTNFGFTGGRTVGRPDMFMTTSYDYDAPLLEAGGRGAKYQAVKRLCMFVNHFGPLMAHCKPGEHHTVATSQAKQLSVAQQSGTMGEVVFISRSDLSQNKQVELLSPWGMPLTVNMGRDAAAWIVLRANLDGVATLDMTNLRPWAFVRREMLVLYGPAGTDAVVSIDGAEVHDTVPTDARPRVHRRGDVTVVILSDKQVDAAYIHDDGRLFVGIAGFDAAGEPIRGDAATAWTVSPGGQTARQALGKAARLTAPRLTGWQHAGTDGYVDGSAPRYAVIDGPRSLEQCGADFGYGWYRISLKLNAARKFNLMLPRGGDRLHLYHKGRLKQIVGLGPGAQPQPAAVSLPRGASDLVVFADNLGRFNYGPGLGERKGLADHLYHVKPIRLPKAELTQAPAADPFEITGYVQNMQRGDRTLRPRYTYTLNHRRKTPLLLAFEGDRPRSVIIVNGQPVALDTGLGIPARVMLDPEAHLKRGNNTITLATFDPADDGFDPAGHLKVYEAAEAITAKAGWAYARWQMPDDQAFDAMPRQGTGVPGWYRATFSVAHTDAPLWLEIAGLSKGQIYLNGRNIGRYFVTTPTGRKVPPQSRYYLPEPWLVPDGVNELIVFDEHGRLPTRCKLVYDRLGPYNGK